MIIFKSKKFNELTTKELLYIMELRSEVFVVEQNCVYQDIDGKDHEAIHIIGFNDQKKIIAYSRILAKGNAYLEYPAIGRIVVSPKSRGKKIGHRLLDISLQKTEELYPKETIKISAQSHLVPFYNTHGFTSIGEEYLEDGIPHIAMLLKK